MVVVTGWLAVVCIALAAALPLGHRLKTAKRAAPSSPTIRTHVVLGAMVSLVAFTHIVSVLPELGSPKAITGGAAAMAAGALAFFVLVAHTGVGLQLRNEKLKERPRKRRAHGVTALIVVLAATLHVLALRR